ncbi:MAG: MBL fold metallo-hydrolase [Deltaproteobacteria bacterium]|nr:MBL fold metallo-hydrolase [Deltaproteobacteria bacterium]
MDRQLSVTILGAGTGVPLKDRQAPGLAVQAGPTHLILDSGSGAAYQLAKAGIDYHRFDHLLYTHYAHPDHINDLPELIFANEYFDPRRKRELAIFGPRGMQNFFEKLVALYPILGRVTYPIKIHELQRSTLLINDVVIKSSPLNHQGNECVGYRIEYGGKSLIYSGDTDYCKAMIDLAQGGDLLIAECSFPNQYKVAGHLIPTDVGMIARQARVKKVVLTHLYPLCDQFDVVAQVREKFHGEVLRAEDLITLTL